MTQILLAGLVVFAMLAAHFTDRLFRHGGPLLERLIRQRLRRADADVALQRELDELRERVARLERGRGQP